MLLLTLAVFSCSALAQQGTAIQPCKDTSAASKTRPVSGPVEKASVTEILIDASIPDDLAIEKMLAPYSSKVRALEIVVGRLEGGLRKGGIGGGTLGNFVADGIRSQAGLKLRRPVLLAITNSGGLRKNAIAPGDLRVNDIFELLPFENALLEMDLTGKQLLKLLGVVTARRDAQSGARIKYRINSEKLPELISATLVDSQGHEKEIDPTATYTIVTIDYLLKLASGSYSILQEGKNIRPLGITIRDAILDYLKSESAIGRPIRPALDGRFFLVGPDSLQPEEPE